MDKELKDGGTREQFLNGAVKETSVGKSRPDLISPFFTERLGKVLAKGINKYGEYNWSLGIPNSRFYESTCRHLMQYAKGEVDEDHLVAVAFNIMAMIHNEEMDKQGVGVVKHDVKLCDMPRYKLDCVPKEYEEV